MNAVCPPRAGHAQQGEAPDRCLREAVTHGLVWVTFWRRFRAPRMKPRDCIPSKLQCQPTEKRDLLGRLGGSEG